MRVQNTLKNCIQKKRGVQTTPCNFNKLMQKTSTDEDADNIGA